VCSALRKNSRGFSFVTTHDSLTAVLTDHTLASLGDAFVNLICSLALSNRKGKPLGVKIKGSLLAGGLRRAGLRPYVQSRVTRHMLADAAEALMVYAWLHDCVTLDESVATLEKDEDLAEGLAKLLQKSARRIKLS
jgi:hypothetical protein